MLAIGRALLTNPKVLIMDEPSEGLAPTIVEGLVQTIKDLAAEGMGLLVVEQNLGVATSLAERQLIMVTGQIATETTAAELAADPAAQRRYLGVEPLPTRRSGSRTSTPAGWGSGSDANVDPRRARCSRSTSIRPWSIHVDARCADTAGRRSRSTCLPPRRRSGPLTASVARATLRRGKRFPRPRDR